MIFNHSRFQIWNGNQHPYVHKLSEFRYANKALPNILNAEDALNYILAVLYPNAKESVEFKSDLPDDASLNDYRVVLNDGDGKSAGYRFEQREGEAAPSWHKIYDFDWGTDEILQAWENRTQDLFVMRGGYDDIDEFGNKILGDLAGQRLFGGKSANTNLTLSANSGDGDGVQTGFVQMTDNVRPVSETPLSLGTNAERWGDVFSDTVHAGDVSVSSGEVVSSSGSLSFGTNDVSTAGKLTASFFSLQGNNLTNTTGQISFGDENLVTTGNVSGANATFSKVTATTNPSAFKSGTSIGAMTFNDNAQYTTLDTTGSNGFFFNKGINVPQVMTGTIFGNLQLSVQASNTSFFSSVSINGELEVNDFLSMNGNQIVGVDSISASTGNFGNISISGNSIQSVSGSIQINGVSSLSTSGSFTPSVTGLNLGSSTNTWNNLWITGSIGGATQITVSDLIAFRNANFRDTTRTQAAQVGDSLFWNGTQWLASKPDTEITHNTVSGLTTGDAGHTQFVMLSGRSSGQTINGGTGISENLVLQSTSSATKGTIQAADSLTPTVDSGANLGSSTKQWNNVYTSGQMIGMRVENVAAFPANSGTRIGRLVYLTTDGNIYSDTGTAWKQVGGTRFFTDTVWNGTETTKDVTVSGVDARLAVWQLKDNNNDFECMFVEIKTTSATNVRITVGTALPAGSYRLVGV